MVLYPVVFGQMDFDLLKLKHPFCGSFNYFYFHPYLGRWSNLTVAKFSNGLKPPSQISLTYTKHIILYLQGRTRWRYQFYRCMCSWNRSIQNSQDESRFRYHPCKLPQQYHLSRCVSYWKKWISSNRHVSLPDVYRRATIPTNHTLVVHWVSAFQPLDLRLVGQFRNRRLSHEKNNLVV